MSLLICKRVNLQRECVGRGRLVQLFVWMRRYCTRCMWRMLRCDFVPRYCFPASFCRIDPPECLRMSSFSPRGVFAACFLLFLLLASILLTPAVKDRSGAVESRLCTGIVFPCLIAWVIFITAKWGCLWDTCRDQLFSPTAFMPSDWNVMKLKWNDSWLVPYHRKWVTHIVYLDCILHTYLKVRVLNNYLRCSN